MKYKEAGVDIDSAEVFKAKIKKLVKQTYSQYVVGDIGLFGSLFKCPYKGKDYLIVSSVDGVGTKTIIANLVGDHTTIGYDVVSHGANDIVCQGAIPLFFMDYIGVDRLNQGVLLQLMKGMVRCCKEIGCSLIGGETAQMGDVYREGEYDLVGCMIGIVKKSKVINGKKIKVGDVLIGLKSWGLHTNGYTLARKVLLKKYKVDTFIPKLKTTIGESLLKPHRCYSNLVLNLQKKVTLNGIAHITGGGFYDNIKRILPGKVDVIINPALWKKPPIFELIQEEGQIPLKEMYRTFNMGIGMTLFIKKEDTDKVLEKLKGIGAIVGEVVKGTGNVIIKGVEE